MMGSPAAQAMLVSAIEPAGAPRLGPGDAAAIPGVEITPLPGHTPGHTGFVVGEGADRLWLWGDTVHLASLQFARPGATIAFDVDRDGAAGSRRLALDRAANERLLVAGAHLPFPGLGYVAREGRQYRFVPAPWQPL